MPDAIARTRALLFLAAAAPRRTAGERGLRCRKHRQLDQSVPRLLPVRQWRLAARDRAFRADYATWGVDEEIDQRNLGILRDILENAASHPGDARRAPLPQDRRLLRRRDGRGRDRTARDWRRCTSELAANRRAEDRRDDVAALIRDWQVRGIDVLFELQAQEDLKDSGDEHRLRRPGRPRPARSRLLPAYGRQVGSAARAVSQAHIARMLALLGDAKAEGQKPVMGARPGDAPGQGLARLRRAARPGRTPTTSSRWRRPMRQTPHFALGGAVCRRPDAATCNGFRSRNPNSSRPPSKALADVPLCHLAGLPALAADRRLLRRTSARRFVDADFDFRGRTLRGIKDNKPRWKRAIASTDAALGEALGQAYVAQR